MCSIFMIIKLTAQLTEINEVVITCGGLDEVAD